MDERNHSDEPTTRLQRGKAERETERTAFQRFRAGLKDLSADIPAMPDIGTLRRSSTEMLYWFIYGHNLDLSEIYRLLDDPDIEKPERLRAEFEIKKLEQKHQEGKLRAIGVLSGFLDYAGEHPVSDDEADRDYRFEFIKIGGGDAG